MFAPFLFPHTPFTSPDKGTNQYEAIEVRDRRYLFRDETFDANLSSHHALKFNCLHDLESVWWIAVWVLFHHTPMDNKEDCSTQILRAAQLFPPAGNSEMRVGAFLAGTIRYIVGDLAPAFQPGAIKMLDARTQLILCYKAAEKGSPIDEIVFNGIHESLVAIWQKARDESRHIEYRFALWTPKRGATEEPTSDPQGPSKKSRTSKG
jgi:hypothetical protein